MSVFVQRGMDLQSFILACQNQNQNQKQEHKQNPLSNLTQVNLSALQTQAVPWGSFSPVLRTAANNNSAACLSTYLSSLQAVTNNLLESRPAALVSTSPLCQYGGNEFVSNLNFETSINPLIAALPNAGSLLSNIGVVGQANSNQPRKCEIETKKPANKTPDKTAEDLGHIGNISVLKLREKYIQCSKIKEEIEREAKRRLITVAQGCSLENVAKKAKPSKSIDQNGDMNYNRKETPRLQNTTNSVAPEISQKTAAVDSQIGEVQTRSAKQPGLCRFKNCSNPPKSSNAKFCSAHGGGRRRCEFLDCTKATQGRTLFCIAHGGGRRCEFPECTKAARGATKFCISHGGGRRCEYPECTKGARGAKFCSSHGGGKRCQFKGCPKGALGRTSFCNMHGGGNRCSFPNCGKSARGKTKFCSSHGGGSRCQFPGCKLASVGKLPLCVSHGGGSRCKFRGCNKAAQSNDLFCGPHKKGDSQKDIFSLYLATSKTS